MLVDLLVLAGVPAAIVAAFLGVLAWLRRGGGSGTDLVLLATAAGREEARLWLDALRREGIPAHVRNVGDSAWFTSPYAIEVWVRPRDADRARQALGL